MVKIFLADLRKLQIGDQEITKWVSKERQLKAKRLKKEEGKKAALAGEYMLNKGLFNMQKEGIFPLSCKNITFPLKYEKNQYGAPCLPGSGLWFNWSHSGSYGVCAIGDGPVGIDIQKHKVFSFSIAQKNYPKEIVNRMEELSPNEREQLFFRYWTLWEGCLKARGTGFYEKAVPLLEKGELPPSGCVQVARGEKWHYQFLQAVEEYEICVVTEKVEKIHFDDLTVLC